MDFVCTFAPAITFCFLLFVRIPDRLHALFYKDDIFAEVHNWKSVSYMLFLIPNCKVKPFIIPFRVGVILKEKYIVAGCD